MAEGDSNFGVEDLLGNSGCPVYLVYWAPHHPPTPHPTPHPSPARHLDATGAIGLFATYREMSRISGNEWDIDFPLVHENGHKSA